MERLTCITIVLCIQGWVVQQQHQIILQTQAQQVTQKKIFQGHAVTQPDSSITATCNRVQRVGGIVSSTSGTATIGREKWELITNNSVTWTQIAA